MGKIRVAHFCPGDSCQGLSASSSSGPQTEPQQKREVCPSVGSNKNRSELHGLQEWLGGCPRKEIPSVYFLWEFELYNNDASVDLLRCIS